MGDVVSFGRKDKAIGDNGTGESKQVSEKKLM